MTMGNDYLQSIVKRLKEYKALGDHTFVQLQAKDFQLQPGYSNSIAIIIKHMHGNMVSR